MDITEIISVSPVNPAHGRHEVHAQTNVNLDVAFTISPEALGSLTGYFGSFPNKETAYLQFLRHQAKLAHESDKKEGS